MSSLAGNTYFNSGPHRFTTRTLGSLVVSPLAIDFLQTDHVVLDTLQLVIIQTGRLIGTDWDKLWYVCWWLAHRTSNGTSGM